MPRPEASNLFTFDEANTCMAGLKSVTHEAMEIGARRPAKSRDVFKKILSFSSLSTSHFARDSAPESRLPTGESLFSVYTRDYTWTRGSQNKPPCKRQDTLPDSDFCRRPVNSFYNLPQSNFKFMDDHLRSDLVPERRKKIDFFRQISCNALGIEAHEDQVKTLKQTIDWLEMDNSLYVYREADLRTTITEKDSTIESLQQSLKELSRDVLRDSKEEHMRFVCPDLESSCERICNKCQELVSLLPVTEGKDFEKIASESEQLRSEIAATRAKLENVQSAFTRQISTAHNDFGRLQERYDTLEQQSQGHKLAIENMQAEYQAIQQKYQKLQQEYESLGRTSNASEEHCQQLQAGNTRLQAEIGTLKERVKEAQRRLMQAPGVKAIDEEFKAQNADLKAKLAEMELNFNQIQEEYDSLSNQLMEAVQENDALREELKQRRRSSCGLDSMKSSGVDSMKSSGMGPDLGEPDQDLLQQFAQLSASLRQIELKDHFGLSRLFRGSQQEQDENMTGFKLCLESAKYIEGESHPAEASDGIHLKGVLKHQVFQFVALSQEQLEAGKERRFLNIISQLEQEIRDKNELLEATKATINEMRDQMTNLESELLEKSVIVNKVEDYQRQIETLEKQKAEITMVNEELQDKVHRNSTMSESLLHIPPDERDDTISGSHDSSVGQSQEVASLRASLAELKAKVCELQAEVESQLRQMQLKDRNIAELRSEIEEMGERCLSSEVKLVEVDNHVREKQQLLDRQSRKLSDDALLIDQLQEMNAKLQERKIKQDQAVSSSEYAKQIEELKEELITKEKLKMEECNALQLEFMVKMEASETENRAKFCGYTLELEESKERYEATVATLKEQLLQAGEELSRVKDRCQTELEENRAALKERLGQEEAEQEQMAVKETLNMELVENQAKNVQHQAELVEILKEKLTASEAKAAQHQAELEAIKKTLKEKLAEAEAKQDCIEGITSRLGAREAELAEQESALDSLKMENQKLLEQMQVLTQVDSDKIQDLQAKSDQQAVALDNMKQEKISLQSDINEAHLQHLSTKNNLRKLEKEMEALSLAHGDLVARHQESIASSNGKIEELQEKSEQQLQDMDTLRKEKSVLRVQIKEADAQHSCTLKKLHELERELEDMSQEKAREKSDLEEKLEILTAKINDVKAELQGAKRKACSYDDLISEHDKLKSSLSEATVVSSNLQEKVASLQSQLLAYGQEVSNRDLEIKELRSELRHALEAKDTASAEQVALATQLQALEETMSSRGGKFQKEVADLKGSLNELQMKLASLQGRKDELESDNDELKVKLRNAHILQGQLEEEQKVCSSLRAKLVELEEANTRLEEQIRAKESELTKECDQLRSDLQAKTMSFQTEKAGLDSNVSSLLRYKQLLEEKINSLNLNGDRNAELMAQLRAKMEQKVEELTKEIDELRTAMKSKESSFMTERERMNGTISSLLEDKRNLEEKQCTLTEIVTKMEAERALKISGGNSSFESNASAASSTSTKASSKLDRHAATSGIKKSSYFDSAMRRDRRMAAHDVRRKSSIWDTSRDCVTMTDSEDLKAENEQLQSRLLEEQQKGERLKQKIRDLTGRIGYHFD